MSIHTSSENIKAAVQLHSNGDIESAEESYKQLIAGLQATPVVYSNLGVIYMRSSRIDEAETLFKEAIKLKPDYYEVLNNLGILYESQEKYNEAIQYFNKTITVKPDFEAAYLHLSTILQSHRHTKEAIEVLQKAIKINPRNASFQFNLGKLQLNTGKLNNALETFKICIDLNDNFPAAHNNLGTILLIKGQLENAKKCFQKALTYQPKHADAHSNLGSVLYEQGDVDKAVESLKLAIKHKPDFIDAYQHLGKLYLEKNNLDDAEYCFNYILSTDTNNFDACYLNAITSYLKDQVETCSTFIEQIEKVTNTNPIDRHALVFIQLIKKLIIYQAKHPDLFKNFKHSKSLYLFGESHCLSPSGMSILFRGTHLKVLSSIIFGAKAWHFSHSNSRYKSVLKNKLKQLPANSAAVFMFGEIDCRDNEGILLASLKKGDDLETIIENTVTPYFHFCVDLCNEYNLEPMFYGVPAPLEGSNATSKRIQVIEKYNDFLKLLCLDAKIEFINIHAVTITDSGYADKSLHIDNIHLKPIAFSRAIEALN